MGTTGDIKHDAIRSVSRYQWRVMIAPRNQLLLQAFVRIRIFQNNPKCRLHSAGTSDTNQYQSRFSGQFIHRDNITMPLVFPYDCKRKHRGTLSRQGVRMTDLQ